MAKKMLSINLRDKSGNKSKLHFDSIRLVEDWKYVGVGGMGDWNLTRCNQRDDVEWKLVEDRYKKIDDGQTVTCHIHEKNV